MTRIISENTTWKTGSVISLSEDVEIAPDVTLTIQEGVLINANNFNFRVYGSLVADGEDENKIVFNDAGLLFGADHTTPGYIFIDNVNFFNGSFLRPTGYASYGSFDVTNSKFTGTTGFYIWYPEKPSVFQSNIFDSTSGLSIGTHQEGEIKILNNLFFNQKTPYAVESWANYNNGIFVEGNSFLDTGKIVLALKSGYSDAAIDASDNYFGVNDNDIINEMILDRNDSLQYPGYIATSFISEPHPNTPSKPEPALKIDDLSQTQVGRNGMIVTLDSVQVNDRGNGYTDYVFEYTETNPTSVRLSQETFVLYMADGTVEKQYGFFNYVYPGESTTGVFSVTIENAKEPAILEYDQDNFFSESPILGSAQWGFNGDLVSKPEPELINNTEDGSNIQLVNIGQDGGLYSADILVDGTDLVTAEEAQLYRSYYGAMGRMPDKGGYDWWLGEIQAGRHTLESMAGGFIWSDEFKGYADTDDNGSISNGELISHMYNGVFGREPDEGGYNWWVEQLDSGAKTQAGAFIEMTQSNEFVEITLIAVADFEFTS